MTMHTCGGETAHAWRRTSDVPISTVDTSIGVTWSVDGSGGLHAFSSMGLWLLGYDSCRHRAWLASPHPHPP